jgi:hypothetical protein
VGLLLRCSPSAQIAGYYGQIYALAILGVGLTIAGFYLGASLDQLEQT